MDDYMDDYISYINNNNLHNDVPHMVNEMVTECVEKRDEFIFTILADWLYLEYRIVVSKELLLEAVLEHQKNHPEKWENN